MSDENFLELQELRDYRKEREELDDLCRRAGISPLDLESDVLQTRLAAQYKLDQMRPQIEHERRQAQREAQRQRDHAIWQLEQDANARKEARRIADNIVRYGHLRPENYETYKSMPPEFKVKMTQLFGGGFVSEIFEKSKTGLTWEKYDELKKLVKENDSQAR